MTIAKRLARHPSLAAYLLFLTALATPAAHSQVSPSASPQHAGFRYTVPPSKPTAVQITTLPNALCTLRSPDDSRDSKHSLTIFSDSEGAARFFANPSKRSEQPVRVVVECTAEGQSASYDVELRADPGPTREMPAPSVTKMPIPKDASIRPALTETEALRLSDEELVKRHYPVPPSQKEFPAAYRAWVKAISVPVLMIPPKFVYNPNLTHKPLPENSDYKTQNDPIWSGMELRGAAGSYAWIQGSWIVPAVNAEHGFYERNDSATWIGIDGVGTSDFVQCGTEQQAYRVFWIQFTSYDPWTNFYPQVENAPMLSNFSVNPGDEIYSQISIANAGGAPDLSGAFASYYMEDTNSSGGSVATEIYTPVGTTAVSGEDAEWIEERPSTCPDAAQCPNPVDLANYGTVSITGAVARRPNAPDRGGYVGCCGAGSYILTITSGAEILSTVAVIDDSDMKFTWHAYH